MTTPANSFFDEYVHRGNPTALGHLYDHLAPELLTLALHLTGHPAQAEDLVQEVFLKAIQEPHGWDDTTPVESWLSHLLAETLECTRKLQGRMTSLTEHPEGELPCDPHDPVAAAQQVELSVQLECALASLPERYRSVVRLSVQDGRTSEEVGEILQRPAGTVRSQLARGLDRLRQILPAALGLAIWNSVRAADAVSPLEAMKKRFLEKACGSHIPTGSSIAAPTPIAIQAMGVAALVIGIFYLGLQGFQGSPRAQELGDSHTRLAKVKTETQLFDPSTPGVMARTAPIFESAAPDPTKPHITGTVIDAAGKPLANAQVSVFYWEPWGPGQEDTRLEEVGGFGYSTTTDAIGAYSFETPCLPPGPPTLHLSAGAGYTEKKVRFSSNFSQLKPLRIGENTLPPMQLLPAGKLVGFSQMEDGSPAHPAYIEFQSGGPSDLNPIYWSNPDGTFAIDQVPAGTHVVRITFQGKVRQATVEVIPDSTTQLRPILFSPSIPIRIHVVDSMGKDLQGASVLFEALSPSEATHYPRETSNADGIIEAMLPTADQHGISITAIGFTAEQELYRPEPGQRDLEVRMLPARVLKLRVFDASTLEPLARYNLQAQVQVAGRWEGVGRVDHQKLDADGTRPMTFTPNGRCKVSRNGYQTAYIPFDESTAGIIELSLKRTQPVVGRLLLAGTPVVGAPIEIGVRDVSGLVQPSPLDLRAHERSDGEDLIWAQTNALGVYSFDPHEDPESWYCLRTHDDQGHALEHWFQIPAGGTSPHELGDLELEPSGTLRGRILVSECSLQTGLVFLADLETGTSAAATNPQGEFELKNLAPGTHYLRMQTTAGLAPLPLDISFTIEPGQTLEQEFDLRPLELSARQLNLSSQGAGLGHHRVYLCTEAVEPTWSELEPFGTTDANGDVAGSVPCGGFASVWVQSPAGEAPRKHPTALIPLTCRPLPSIPIEF